MYQRDREEAYSIEPEQLAGDTSARNMFKWNAQQEPPNSVVFNLIKVILYT